MSERTDLLRAPEAAIVSGIAVKEVDRAVDERILPDGFVFVDGGRMFSAGACVMIAFYNDAAKDLTRELRRHVIHRFEHRLRHVEFRQWGSLRCENWNLHEGYWSIDLAPFIERAAKGYTLLREAEAAVTSSWDVMGGAEVLRGTRVPVHDVAASVAAGYPRERIHDAYPSLTDQQIDLAVTYAAARPQRGRPRGMVALPGNIKVIESRVARRKKPG